MDERARLRVRPDGRCGPELGAQEHDPELGRVHVRVRPLFRARAAVVAVREKVVDPGAPRDALEVAQHCAVPRRGVRAEPGVVPRGGPGVVGEEQRRLRRVALGVECGGGELRLLGGRAAGERRPLAVAVDGGAGDDELAPGERGRVRRGGGRRELGDLVLGVHNVEGRRCGVDRVLAVARVREVVRRRNCYDHGAQDVSGRRGPVDLLATSG